MFQGLEKNAKKIMAQSKQNKAVRKELQEVKKDAALYKDNYEVCKKDHDRLKLDRAEKEARFEIEKENLIAEKDDLKNKVDWYITNDGTYLNKYFKVLDDKPTLKELQAEMRVTEEARMKFESELSGAKERIEQQKGDFNSLKMDEQRLQLKLESIETGINRS